MLVEVVNYYCPSCHSLLEVVELNGKKLKVPCDFCGTMRNREN